MHTYTHIHGYMYIFVLCVYSVHFTKVMSLLSENIAVGVHTSNFQHYGTGGRQR